MSSTSGFPEETASGVGPETTEASSDEDSSSHSLSHEDPMSVCETDWIENNEAHLDKAQLWSKHCEESNIVKDIKTEEADDDEEELDPDFDDNSFLEPDIVVKEEEGDIPIDENGPQGDGESFRCFFCLFESVDINEVEAHIKCFHLTKNVTRCPFCNYLPAKPAYLIYHIRSKHTKERPYKCPQCEFRAVHPSYMKYHNQSLHLLPASSDSGVSNDSVDEDSARNGREKKYQCFQCDFRASCLQFLTIHIRSYHSNGEIFKCPDCSFTSTTAYGYRVHCEYQHRVQKAFRCSHCDFAAPRFSGLKKHSIIHRGNMEDSYLHCPDCNYKCLREPSLRFHIKAKHENITPYKCPFCDYSVANPGYLKTHIQRKHSIEKNFKCTECDYSATTATYLKAHISTRHAKEKNHKCPECDFATSHGGSLNKHIMARHKKERPNQCPHCSFCSTQAGHLKTHILAVHLNEKRYSCHFCDFRSAYVQAYKKHLRKIHPNQSVKGD